MSALASAPTISVERLPQSWRSVISPPESVAVRLQEHLRRLPGGVLDLESLTALVTAVAADDDAWQPLVVVDADRRR
jgi:hypothetical protein